MVRTVRGAVLKTVLCSSALLLTAGGVTARADIAVGLNAGLQDTQAGSTGKLHLVLSTSASDGSKPPRATALVLQLPRGAVVDPNAADTCSARKLRAGHRCPTKSRVGSGVVTLDIREGSANTVTGPVTAYNAKPNNSQDASRILLEVNQVQTQIRAVLEGRVVRNGVSPFGYTLRFDLIPAIQTAAGTVASVTKLDITMKARRRVSSNGSKRVSNYYRNPTTCTGPKLWYFGADLTFEGGLPLTVAKPLVCQNS